MIWWHTSVRGILTNDDCVITIGTGELFWSTIEQQCYCGNRRNHKHKWKFVKLIEYSPCFKIFFLGVSDGIHILMKNIVYVYRYNHKNYHEGRDLYQIFKRYFWILRWAIGWAKIQEYVFLKVEWNKYFKVERNTYFKVEWRRHKYF